MLYHLNTREAPKSSHKWLFWRFLSRGTEQIEPWLFVGVLLLLLDPEHYLQMVSYKLPFFRRFLLGCEDLPASLLLAGTYCYVCECAKSLQLCLTLRNLMDGSPPGSSVCGILQARILQWVALPFSRGSSQPRDWIQVSCIAGGFFTVWATREPQALWNAAFLHLLLLTHFQGSFFYLFLSV